MFTSNSTAPIKVLLSFAGVIMLVLLNVDRDVFHSWIPWLPFEIFRWSWLALFAAGVLLYLLRPKRS
jgi:hypothetical protein